MQLPSFKTLLASGKEKIDELMAPARAELVKAKFFLRVKEIETEILADENNFQEMLASYKDEKKIDFDKLDSAWDDIEIKEARLERYKDLCSKLFPKSKKDE